MENIFRKIDPDSIETSSLVNALDQFLDWTLSKAPANPGRHMGRGKGVARRYSKPVIVGAGVSFYRSHLIDIVLLHLEIGQGQEITTLSKGSSQHRGSN